MSKVKCFLLLLKPVCEIKKKQTYAVKTKKIRKWRKEGNAVVLVFLSVLDDSNCCRTKNHAVIELFKPLVSFFHL